MKKLLGLILCLLITGMMIACSQGEISDSKGVIDNTSISIFESSDLDDSLSGGNKAEESSSLLENSKTEEENVSSDDNDSIEGEPNELPLVPYS